MNVHYSPAMIEQHRAHQARLQRIADRAIAPVIATPIPEPIVEKPKPLAQIVNAAGHVEDLSDEKIREINASIRAVRPVSVATIQHVVGTYYGFNRAALMAKTRAGGICRARHMAVYLCKQMTPYSLPEIGRRFGGRDHTTALHSVRRVSEKLPADSAIVAEVKTLQRLILNQREDQ